MLVPAAAPVPPTTHYREGVHRGRHRGGTTGIQAGGEGQGETFKVLVGREEISVLVLCNTTSSIYQSSFCKKAYCNPLMAPSTIGISFKTGSSFLSFPESAVPKTPAVIAVNPPEGERGRARSRTRSQCRTCRSVTMIHAVEFLFYFVTKYYYRALNYE